MPTMRCPHCQHALTLPDGAAAPPGACPRCGRAAAAAGRWWVVRGGRKAGPFTWAQLQALARRGQLRGDDAIVPEGAKQGVAARDVPRLLPPAAPIATAPPARPRIVMRGVLGAVALLGLLVLAAVGWFAYQSWSTPVAEPPGPQVAAAKPDKPPPPTRQEKLKPPPEKKPAPPPKQQIDPKAAAQAKELADQLLRQVNTFRKMAGLGLVQLDPALNRGCAAHAKYLAQNPPTGPGAPARLLVEDPDQPGFSAEGKQAAAAALVAIGDPRHAVEPWMARLSGRLPLLKPELHAVGLGLEPLPGGAWAAVLDVRQGGGSAPVVLYPVPGQIDVPLTFTGGPELPEATATAGFPVTVTFPPLRRVTHAQAELRDDAGRPVDAWRSTPEQPARAKGQHNTVALIAKAALHGNRVYRVHVAATLDGAPWSKDWSFTTADDADGKGVWAHKALERVNGYRKQAGLAPVVLDEQLSQGCRAHARYLALNLGHPATAGLGAHDEDLGLPGASAAGARAGKASDIGIGDHEPLDALEAWMATLYHRVPILEPNLKTVGFGCARARRQGWVTVLNVSAGRARVPRPHRVVYPVPDQTGVPLHFPIGGEEPNPIPDDTTGRAGFPVTAFFPEAAPLKSASAVLTDAAGKEVAVWFSAPEQPANPQFAKLQGNTVCLIPRAPLKPNTTYRVVLRGQQAGKPWDLAWRFTTGGAGPTVAEAGQQALERINAYRATAGLAAVALDAALSKGCQAHAEYLVRNAAALAKQQLAANDEDSALPGYSVLGKAAARQSDVFSQAPAPVTQIDDLMGTFLRRVALLDPQLQRVGLGHAHDVGRGWRCVLDLFGGRGGERIVVFPVPDQEGVPCAGSDRLPQQTGAAGYPVSVTFPARFKLLGGRGVLTDTDGKTVETLLTTPEHPLDTPALQGNTVALHPRAPLRPGQTYSVTLSVVVNGQEWRQTWQFTTE